MGTMWSVLVNWYTVGIVTPVLIGIGIGVLSMTPPHYTVAQACFSFSASILGGRLGWWIAFEQPSDRSLAQKILFSLIIFGILGALWTVSVVWVESLRPIATTTSTNPIESLRFKHTALVFHARHGSAFVAGRPVSLKAEYENTTDYRASEISASGVLRFIEAGDSQAEQESQEWKAFRDMWLSTLQGTLKTDLDGHKSAFIDAETDPLSNEQVQALKTGRQLVYFLGIVKWSDSTGVYETDICTYFSPDQRGTADAPAVWYDGKTGHNAVRRPFQVIDIVAPFSQRASIQIIGLEFVRPSQAIPLQPSKPFLLNVAFKNTGPIPANKVAMFARLGISATSSEQADQEKIFQTVKKQAKESEYGPNSLLPGKTEFITVQYPLVNFGQKALSRKDIERIKSGEAKLVLAILAKYVDDYGPRETYFCQSYYGLSWRFWTDCYGHNEIVDTNKP